VKLRNAHLALVERHKIVEYLLNAAHPDNGGKAQFFESLGFSSDASDALITALRHVGRTGEVVERTESSHGEKFVVDGPLSSHTEGGYSPKVRTIWIIDRHLDIPRLVTAYPGKE
jgi:hypothetical protein